MIYTYAKNLKDLAGKVIKIKEVLPAYRQQRNESTGTMTKFRQIDWVWHQENWNDKTRSLEKKEPSYKDTNKVFDIVIGTFEDVKVDGQEWNEFTIKWVTAANIKKIAEATVAFGKIPQKEDWTPAYDWEDRFLEELKDKVVIFSAKNAKTPSWKDYAELTFKEASEPVKEDVDDLPFK